jgi:hypothetical protein
MSCQVAQPTAGRLGALIVGSGNAGFLKIYMRFSNMVPTLDPGRWLKIRSSGSQCLLGRCITQDRGIVHVRLCFDGSPKQVPIADCEPAIVACTLPQFLESL